MHAEAHEWVRAHVRGDELAVLDLGGRDINGTVRALFPHHCRYTVVDIAAGNGVTVVADAADWIPDQVYDLVVCCEVFEHTPRWPQILETAYTAAAPAGRLITTMAGPGRPSHSGVDGGWSLHDGEHYANIDPGELAQTLRQVGWRDIVVDQRPHPADVRAVAVR